MAITKSSKSFKSRWCFRQPTLSPRLGEDSQLETAGADDIPAGADDIVAGADDIAAWADHMT